jgi:hypothetical protein
LAATITVETGLLVGSLMKFSFGGIECRVSFRPIVAVRKVVLVEALLEILASLTPRFCKRF